MESLHKKDEYGSTQTRLEGGLQASLCSNSVLPCSSPLGLSFSQDISEDDALDYLADIYLDIYFNQIKQNDITNSD